MRVSFVLDGAAPVRLDPILAETRARLEASGVQVALRIPEHELTRIDDLSVDADLYLLRSSTSLAFTLSTVLHRLGAPLLNRYNACLATRDQVVAAAVLASAGIPAPRSLVAGKPQHLVPELVGGPLILKSPAARNGHTPLVARSAACLPGAAAFPAFVLAQDYLPHARTDLQVFAIGEHCFGVREVFAANTLLGGGTPVRLGADVEELVAHVGRAFDLELYGVRLAEDEQGMSVVDVTATPSFRGVPDAARHLATYIQQVIRRA